MAEPYKHIYKVDLNQQLVRRDVGLLATFDSKANRFGAELYRDGASVSASGYEVMGYFIRPDDETVNCPGTVEGNLVYVDLLPGCYLYDGAFDFTLKIKQGDEEKAVLMCYGNVVRSRTDAQASGGEVVVTVTNAEKLGGKPASAYVQTANVVNNFATTEAGFVADARALKVLSDTIGNLLWSSEFRTLSIAAGESAGFDIANCIDSSKLVPIGAIDATYAKPLAISNYWSSGDRKTLFVRVVNISGGALTNMQCQINCLNLGGI